MQPESSETELPAVHAMKYVALTGPLTMNTVGGWFDQLSKPYPEKHLLLDFAKVTEADSSALAMISAIKRDCATRAVVVSLKELPQSVKTVADIYDAADLLGS